MTETKEAPDETAAGGSLAGRVLLILLHEGRKRREKKNADALKKRLTTVTSAELVREVRALAGRGLVALATEDDRELVSKPNRVSITDAGRAFVRASLTLGAQARLSGAVVNAVLAELREHAAGGTTTVVPVAAAAPEATPPLRDEITRVFRERSAGQSGYVPIWQLRRALLRASREAFDAALQELQKDGILYLSPLNDARDVPADQLADGIRSALRGQLYFASRGDKPWM